MRRLIPGERVYIPAISKVLSVGGVELVESGPRDGELLIGYNLMTPTPEGVVVTMQYIPFDNAVDLAKEILKIKKGLK